MGKVNFHVNVHIRCAYLTIIKLLINVHMFALQPYLSTCRVLPEPVIGKGEKETDIYCHNMFFYSYQMDNSNVYNSNDTTQVMDFDSDNIVDPYDWLLNLDDSNAPPMVEVSPAELKDILAYIEKDQSLDGN